MSIPIAGFGGRIVRVTNTLMERRISIRAGDHQRPQIHLTESEAEGVWAALGELLGKRSSLSEESPEAEAYRLAAGRQASAACDSEPFT